MDDLGAASIKEKDRIQEEVRGCGATSGTDFGCGDGAGGLILAGCGLQPVYLYDPQGFDYLADEIKANAYPTFTYGQYALWDPALPANITDYNLCIDSLEGVPQEKVNLVLDGIALRTRIACFFRIPTSEPPVLWLSQIARRFAAVDYHIEPADHPFKQTLVCTAWKKPR